MGVGLTVAVGVLLGVSVVVGVRELVGVGVLLGVTVPVAVGGGVGVGVSLGTGVSVGVSVGTEMVGGSPRTRAVRKRSRIPVRSEYRVSEGAMLLRIGMSTGCSKVTATTTRDCPWEGEPGLSLGLHWLSWPGFTPARRCIGVNMKPGSELHTVTWK